MGIARRTIETLTAEAGITIDGGEPWDIRVSDDRFFRRVLRHGSLGLARRGST